MSTDPPSGRADRRPPRPGGVSGAPPPGPSGPPGRRPPRRGTGEPSAPRGPATPRPPSPPAPGRGAARPARPAPARPATTVAPEGVRIADAPRAREAAKPRRSGRAAERGSSSSPVGPGGETATGRLRRLRANRPPIDELLPQPPNTASALRRRYGIPYDTQGPKVRLGVLWALLVVASLVPQALRPWGLAVLFGVVAGAAAAQVIDASRRNEASLDRAVAGFAASALPVAATLGAQALGIGFLALAVIAVLATASNPERGRKPLPRAGQIVMAAGICGGAAASLVLLAEYEIGAIIVLLVFVMAYDASDFVVGSGAGNAVEGPVAGMIFIAATAAIAAGLRTPPWGGVDIWSFAVLAMVACPAGQILASAMLPQANAHAPALRRLDTYLIVAPAWAGLVGLYVAQAS